MNALVLYLLTAMLAWAPLTPARLHGEEPVHAEQRYRALATAIASVTLDPAEAPTVASSRPRTALLLASLAFWESGFSELVDEGHCAPGTCDSGIAWTVWQLHPEQGGFVLWGDGWRYAKAMPEDWLLAHADSVISGPAMVLDRQLAARVALHLARKNLGAWTTWRTARRHAEWWWTAHPMESAP